MRQRLTPRKQRGAALILALGILALLTFVAFAFATLTRTELRASQNYRDGEKARYAAWSGIERAKYEIRRAVQTPGYPLPWLLPDSFNYEARKFEQGMGTYDALEPGDTRAATRHPSLGCYLDPIPQALQTPPSLGTVPAAPKLPWPSGILGATYYRDPVSPKPGTQRFLGDYYVLKVTDASALLFVNDQSPHLEGMLDRLAAEVGVTGKVGSKILAARRTARGAFRRLEELKGTLTEDEYRKLEPYLTCAAAVDAKVVENGVVGTGSKLPRLLPLPRAPININLAARPVLHAAFANLAWRDAQGGLHPIDPDKLRRLVQQIENYRADPTIPISNSGNPRLIGEGTRRYGFQSWAEFAQFLVQSSGATGLTPDECACVLANANPNTDVNKFVPDLSIYHSVDKSDLVLGSTEFCFSPTGIFVLESLGIILGPDGKCIAQAKARSVIRAFERYVETTQADFEADRVDPPAAVAQFKGLRDITTLPEFRNSSLADIDPTKTLSQQEQLTGLHAANYDGQVTFNVITQVRISREGMFQGFIDGTLNGKLLPNKTDVQQSGPGALARIAPNGMTSVGRMVDVQSDDDKRWDVGSDVHPFAAFLGRPRVGGATNGRSVVFPQETTINQSAKHYEVPETILTMPVTQTITFSTGGGIAGTINFNLVSRISDYGYDCIENQGFELWYKPSIDSSLDGRKKQALLDWHSGPPLKETINATDMLRNGTATAASTTFNTAFFAGVLNSFATNDRDKTEDITYGMQVYLGIWLEAIEGPAGSGYTLRAKFRGEKLNIGKSRFNGPYEKTWTYATPIQDGTWHHVLLTFAQPALGQVASKRHVSFWADGNEVQHATPSGEPAWPTEISAQGQLIEKTIDDFKAMIAAVLAAEQASGPVGGTGTIIMNAPTYTINFNVEDYRVPAIVPINDDGHTHVGATDPAGCYSELADAVRFLGLVDNVIFDNNWVRKIDRSLEFPNENFIRRYDTWRPSMAADTADDLNGALVYRKHTPALEWQRPIRIIGYEATAWRNAPASTEDRSLIELGRVFLHFGWKRAGDAVPLDVNADYDATLGTGGQPNSPSGWTKRLAERPFNAVGGVYLLADREGRVANSTGFLTRPIGNGSGTVSASSAEEYNYALEILPVIDNQSGPRMAPIIDDVTVIYMPWDSVTVLAEDEVID